MTLLAQIYIYSLHCGKRRTYPHAAVQWNGIAGAVRHADFRPLHYINEQLLAVFGVIFNAHVWLRWILEVTKRTRMTYHVRRIVIGQWLLLLLLLLLELLLLLRLVSIVHDNIVVCHAYWFRIRQSTRRCHRIKARRTGVHCKLVFHAAATWNNRNYCYLSEWNADVKIKREKNTVNKMLSTWKSHAIYFHRLRSLMPSFAQVPRLYCMCNITLFIY